MGPTCGDFENTTFENMVKIYHDLILSKFWAFMDKLGLCKIGHDFISKTDEPYNQSGQFAEADFI